MTILTILKIISYVVVGGIPSVLGIIGYFKQRKIHTAEIQKHKEIEKSLRSQIVDMVENQAEVNKVGRQGKQIKKDLKNMDDDELGIAYNNKLHNMPKKRSRKG